MKKFILFAALLIFATGCAKQGVIPEMKEFVDAFGSKAKMDEVMKKYATRPDIVPEAIQNCDLGKPNITKTEKKDNRILYTAEAVVNKCEKSVTAVGTIRIFQIGWENRKIVSFEWQGPKGGKVEY